MAAHVTFGTVERLAIFGGSWIVAALLPDLARRPWQVRLFTSPRHLEDVVNGEGQTLRRVLVAAGVPYHCSDDINADPEALAWAAEDTLGIAFGAAWAFEPAFAERFAGRLLDFMGIPLPAYRGGAHYTWQILNQERRGACNLQLVLGGEESFHRGPLIRSTRYTVPANAATPSDYFEAALREERRFVNDFLDEVVEGRSFEATELDEGNASYFPFLDTRVNGWLDWGGAADEVARFIGAFGDPYPGASTHWRGRRVHLKDAVVEPEGSHHPFARGLIFRVDRRGVWVCVRDGALRIGRVLDEQGNDIARELVPGSRFFTPAGRLDEALASEIVYSASGPSVERFLP